MSKSLYQTIKNAGAPTSTTVGIVGQTYLDTTTSTYYICTSVSTTITFYTWEKLTGKLDASGGTVTGTILLDTYNSDGDISMKFYNGGTVYTDKILSHRAATVNRDAALLVGTINESLLLQGDEVRPRYNRTSSSDAEGVDLALYSDIVTLSKIYPVGSIYMSVSSTSPASLFGGTWEQLEDRFLLGAGSTYSAGATGGAATVTLTINQMPSHGHQLLGASSYSSNNVYGIFGSYDKAIGVAGGYGGTLQYGTNTGAGQRVIQQTGEGTAHNNMPPYLVVYMWKRTA